jgi:hypothetical protein
MKNIILLLSVFVVYIQLSVSQVKNTDSLLNIQQIKIDSFENDIKLLKQGYEESKVGKDFFNSVITSNMTMYTSIIAIFILLVTTSVGYLTNKRIQAGVTAKIQKQNKVFIELNEKQQKQFDDFKSEVTKRMKRLVKEVKYVESDLSRSFYIICMEQKIYASAFTWSISVINIYLVYNKLEDFTHWLTNTLEALELAYKENNIEDQIYLKEREKSINEIIDKILIFDNKDYKELDIVHEISKQIKAKFNQFLWTEIKKSTKK